MIFRYHYSSDTISLVLSVMLVLLVCISCKKGDSPEVPTHEEVIISLMDQTRKTMEAPGWMVDVTTPAATYRYAGGLSSLGSGAEMDTASLIRIGSITKTFTASLVLILCERGLLSLDDSLAAYFPGFPGAEDIRISHLLNHTSGLTTWDENEEIRMQIYNGTGSWTIDKLLDWAREQELLAEPGQAFHYSNIGYFLLGRIMEQVTGTGIAELLQQEICNPLGFKHTFMPQTPAPPGDIIHGYDGSGGDVMDMTGTPQADAINFELAWTAGGILSTLDELSTWARVLTHGELLSDSMHLQQMPVLKPPTGAVPYYTGYGYGISQTDVWTGHTGAICGFICYMQYNPEADVGIITFFNKFSAFDEDANAADLAAAGANFMALAKHMCPESLQ